MTPLTKQLYFTTSTIINWIDSFSHCAYHYVVVESFDYCQGEGLENPHRYNIQPASSFPYAVATSVPRFPHSEETSANMQSLPCDHRKVL